MSEPPSLESKRQHISQAVLSVHQADIGTNNSVFLAIDVKCAFKEVGALPMNVAIVIDNSVYSSPATLLANCEAASFIVSSLTIRDRFGLHTMSGPLAFGVGGDTVKSDLDSIVTETFRPKASYLRRAVESAAKTQTQNGGLGHLFVLTSNAFALGNFSCDTRFQVHTICAGAIPWSLATPSCGGWSIANRFSQSDFRTQLRLLIDSARSGYWPDQLRNVRVSVTSGSSATIEGVLGSTCFDCLRPGEVRTILVKAHLMGSLLSGFPRGLVTPLGKMDLEGELGAALNLPTLTIQLKYEHSAFPPGTVCEVNRQHDLLSDACSHQVFQARLASHAAMRQNPRKGLAAFETQSNSSEYLQGSDASSHKVVQARLAFHLAMSQNPRKALAALKTQFNSSEALLGMVDELKYQARILERFEHKPTRAVKFPEIDAFPPPPAPLRPRRKESEDDHDPAHQIWAALRERKNQTVLNREASTASLRQIKQMAENNRRSVRIDTLRSLRYENRQENVAPWL